MLQKRIHIYFYTFRRLQLETVEKILFAFLLRCFKIVVVFLPLNTKLCSVYILTMVSHIECSVLYHLPNKDKLAHRFQPVLVNLTRIQNCFFKPKRIVNVTVSKHFIKHITRCKKYLDNIAEYFHVYI